jgi:hypothetical protein
MVFHRYQIRAANTGTIVWVAVLGFVVASLPRILAAGGDLWLDEIWSLYLLRNAKHLWDVLSIQHDNNHILNSAWLFLTGPHGSSFSCRLLSIVSGSAAVAIMGVINLRWGFSAGVVTIGLGAFAYPLIQYSSEARGYAPAMLFALLGYVFLRQAILKKSKWLIAWFQVSVVLGMLSHPTYLYVYVGFLVWMIADLVRRGEEVKCQWIRLAGWNLFPALGILTLYFFFIRKMTLGGGDPRSFADVLASLAILLSGALETRPAEMIGIIIACAGFGWGLVVVKREGGDEWIFFLFSVLLAPLIVWAVARPGFLYERYFLVGLPFYFLMAGRALAALMRGRAFAKAACVFLLVFFMSGNVQRTFDLTTVGRGGYRQALDYLAAQASGSDIILGSDHDFRNKMVLLYYSQFLPAGKRLLYFDQDRLPAGGPEWFVAHSQEAGFRPANRMVVDAHGEYALAQHFPYKGLSGWHWAIYRRQGQSSQ